MKLDKKEKIELLTDFGQPLEHVRLSGPTLFLTRTGYMKNGWAVLNESELYFYYNKEGPTH